MMSDPTEPDRPAEAPPGTIHLPLSSATVGASSSSSSPSSPSMSGSVFSPGPTDPPMGAGAPTSGAPVDDDDDAAPPPRLVGHRRQRVVVVGIALTTAISLMAISLLYYRWATKAEPTASIIVWAYDPGWDAATVTVRGGGLRAPLRAPLRAQDNLLVRFHVPPGDYVVRVESPTGQLLGQRQNKLQQPLRVGSIWWPFRAPAAATQMSLP